jgi:D-alanyl-D-alanine carboxypeptidase
MIENYILKIEELDTSKAKINKEFSDFYNGLFPKADKKKPTAKKEPVKKPIKKKESKKSAQKSNDTQTIKKFLKIQIEKGNMKKIKIVEKTLEKFPNSNKHVVGNYISYGKNKKLTPFGQTVNEDKDGICSFL